VPTVEARQVRTLVYDILVNTLWPPHFYYYSCEKSKICVESVVECSDRTIKKECNNEDPSDCLSPGTGSVDDIDGSILILVVDANLVWHFDRIEGELSDERILFYETTLTKRANKKPIIIPLLNSKVRLSLNTRPGSKWNSLFQGDVVLGQIIIPAGALPDDKCVVRVQSAAQSDLDKKLVLHHTMLLSLLLKNLM